MGPWQILVVEDEPDIRELLVFLLTDGGYGVQDAPNGAVALTMLARRPVDLVLTDINMPVMDGVDLLKAMQATVELRQIPTLVLSALPEAQIRSTCPSMGCFIQKPFRTGDLMARVGFLLRTVSDLGHPCSRDC